MSETQTGRKWKQIYTDGSPLWVDSDNVSPVTIARCANSEWITKLLQCVQPSAAKKMRILEAGCGSGMFSSSLSHLGHRVHAFDYNLEAVQWARRVADRGLSNGKPLFFVGDLLHIPSPDGQYDVTFNQAVLEYFLDKKERLKAISEMVRTVRRGGWVVIIVQKTDHPFIKIWQMQGWQGFANQPDVAVMNEKILAGEMAEAGLKDIRTDGIYPWKSFFAGLQRHEAWRSSRAAYFLGEFLNRFIRLPRFLRIKISRQVIAAGRVV